MLRFLVLLTILLGLAYAPAERLARSPTPDARVLRAASLQSAKRPPGEVIAWLRRQPTVQHVAVGRDGRTLHIRFRNGTQGAILPAAMGTVAVHPPPVNRRLWSLARSDAPAGRAAVWEPFAAELGLGPNAGDLEVKELQSAGFTVDQAYNTAVSVAAMASLSQYNVVYLHTHSGVDERGGGIVATGQPYNGDPSLAPLLAEGSVIASGVAGSSQIYYGITARYISRYEASFPSDAVLFLNGCSLLSAPDFWQALAAKGAGAMASWDRESTTTDNYFAGGAFFAEMDKGLTISAAIQSVLAAGYGKSQVNGQTATLGYLGDGTITLARAAHMPVTSPTPTAVPTTAPTATPSAAPSPSPTAVPPTSTPTRTPAIQLPVLHVRLKQVVAPGQQQVITVQSEAHMSLTVRVIFPNGDAQMLTGTTNSAGVARFSYPQRASEITHRRHTVRVEVRARGTDVVEETYRVKFGVIDISVEPRSALPGSSVTVWVHSRPFTAATISLPGQSGRITSRRLRTNGHGWARTRYQIGRAEGGRIVVVGAAVSIGGRTYRTATTFKVE